MPRANNKGGKKSMKPDTPKPAELPEEQLKTPPALLAAAKEQVEDLIREIQANPNADAGNVIRALLLSAIVNSHTKISEMTLGKMLEEQRRYKELEVKTARWKLDLVFAEQRIKLARLKLREAKQKVASLRRNHKSGRLIDFQGVLNAVSAAIGVGGPLVRRVEAAG